MAIQKRNTVSYDDIEIPYNYDETPESFLKQIVNCPIDNLSSSPELLEVQDYMKISSVDRETLKRDIESSGIIRDPIKVYEKNNKYLILGGFNRWSIAMELGWKHVPIEVVELDSIHRKNLVLDDNLSRRQLTSEQRTAILALRYPDFFNAKLKPGVKPKINQDKSKAVITADEIAKTHNVNKKTIVRSKETYQKALAKATNEGRTKPTVEDIKSAQKEKNIVRKEKEKSKSEPEVVQLKKIQSNSPSLKRNKIFEDNLKSRLQTYCSELQPMEQEAFKKSIIQFLGEI